MKKTPDSVVNRQIELPRQIHSIPMMRLIIAKELDLDNIHLMKFSCRTPPLWCREVENYIAAG